MRNKAKKTKRKKVDLNFESIEMREQFEAFLAKTGRKAGPFLTQQAIEAMAKKTC